MKELFGIVAVLILMAVFIPKACDYDAVKAASRPVNQRPPSDTPGFLDYMGQAFGDPLERHKPRTDAEGTSRPSAPAVPFTDNGDPIELIRRVSLEYDVPAGALYGIWQKESGGLTSGWGSGWRRARDLPRAGSDCMERYGDRCLRHWAALQAICSQRRSDGTRVCDPSEVRTSYALAMGPMQHMPAEILRIAADGTGTWGRRTVDYDGDGVVDPHDLDDAMAMSARFLRHYYEQKVGELGETAAWQWAVNRYYGSQTAGYFEGTGSRPGVAQHWRTWCERYGSCSESRMAYASNP